MIKNESNQKMDEIRFIRIAIGILSGMVFDYREKITPKKAEWNGKTDARRMALGNIYRPCLTNLHLLYNLIVNLSDEKSLNEFARLTGIDGDLETKEKALFDIIHSINTSTILLFQFQVENLLQNLWRELGQEENRSFINLSRSMLQHLQIPDEDELLKRIKTLAYIRNSLHNNGIHNGPNLSYDIKSTLKKNGSSTKIEASYNFEHTKPVTCCGPFHIVGIISEIVEIVSLFLNNQAIKSIDGPIEDRFAWANNPQATDSE